ncbi:MAG: hypothetical protein M3N07_09995 [Pseudomonadota bacterium]|nr:hypothetical protein [Pseudomonadota bacterium]
MLRAILLILALVVLAAIGLVWAGVIEVDWNRDARAPVEVQINPVEVGTTTTNLQVPVVSTETRQVETPAVRVRDDDPAPANAQ